MRKKGNGMFSRGTEKFNANMKENFHTMLDILY